MSVIEDHQQSISRKSLVDSSDTVATTGSLPEPQTGSLASTFSSQRNTTSLRHPVLIRGGNKGPRISIRPPEGRRLIVHLAVVILLVCTIIGALILVIPAGYGAKGGYNPFNPVMNVVNSQRNNVGMVAGQAATATAVTQNSDGQGNGGVTGDDGTSTLSHFFYGQCTYWANMRYHDLTKHWVTWLGNANEWTYGAANSGWVVSSSPNPNGPSIIVLQQYIQGAGGYGHVAVVESFSNGVAHTSNWNWYANGGWATLSYWDFTYPASGVAFIWHP